ncbi:inositol monophosphatase family protein [Planctomicrobium sp. SH668]|uniref:inositol monophosphatase family protein n=1 Tax=Planctomicrobium sp. SH668 TaxID=3448126 RepID=UPI003F5C14E9
MKQLDSGEISQFLRLATRAAENAGKLLLEHQGQFEVLRSEGKDLKSAADLAAENAIFQELDPTGIVVLSEETRADANAILNDLCWIVDPLDGTLNYTRGLPLFCVSIALWRNGAPLLGVIHDPITSTTYSGVVGSGASVNGRSLAVSEIASPSQAILCTGFPSGRSYSSETLLPFVASVQQFKKVRLLGSAALSLAHVAAGHVDAYCEDDIWLWDVAAGLAIVQAAGGEIRFGPWGNELKTRVYATNGQPGITSLFVTSGN